LKRNPISLFGDLWQAAGIYHPNQVRILLHRWDKAGNILTLKKKTIYMTRRFYERHIGDLAFTPGLSAILARASISCWR
jgi:hypothetical protein